MPKLFISYRRSDSIGLTGRIYDRLIEHFGRGFVFMDIDSIPIGINFREYLHISIKNCDIVLAIIGETWLGKSDTGERRIDNPDDFVRMEIETAIHEGIPVIPIVAKPGRMPQASEMPDTLRDLSLRNALELDPGTDFNRHIRKLINSIDDILTIKISAYNISSDSLRKEGYHTTNVQFITHDYRHIVMSPSGKQAVYYSMLPSHEVLDSANILMDDFLQLQGKWEHTFRDEEGSTIYRKKEINGRIEKMTCSNSSNDVIHAHIVNFKLNMRDKEKIFSFYQGEVVEGPHKGMKVNNGFYTYALDSNIWTEIDESGSAYSWKRVEEK